MTGSLAICCSEPAAEQVQVADDSDAIEATDGEDTGETGDADTVDSNVHVCDRGTLPWQDPNHTWRYVTITALDPDAWIDAVGLLPGGSSMCPVYAHNVWYSDLGPGDYRELEVLGSPDGVLDDGTCNDGLAIPVVETGHSVRIEFAAALREGDVIEVREFTACQTPASAPRFEVSVHPGRDDEGVVIGTGSGPIATFELPHGFYD